MSKNGIFGKMVILVVFKGFLLVIVKHQNTSKNFDHDSRMTSKHIIVEEAIESNLDFIQKPVRLLQIHFVCFSIM